jgi:hypothetical protein
MACANGEANFGVHPAAGAAAQTDQTVAPHRAHGAAFISS